MKIDHNTVLLSTAYLPPVEYFYYLLKYDKVIIEQHETYPKQTFRNRCEIYSQSGKLSLIIPVRKVYGNKTITKDIRISNEERWQLNHWRAIKAAYLSSPYFLYYSDELEMFYRSNHDNLIELNSALTLLIGSLIGMDIKLTLTNDFVKTPEDCLDMRFDISPKRPTTINHFPEYIQVFGERHGFISNLSILDLLFNLGPDTINYLEKIGQ